MKGLCCWVAIGAFALGFATVGCGGDDSEESGGSEVGGGGAGADSCRANIECVAADGVDDAACVNDTDCPDVDDGQLRSNASDCIVQNCLTSSDRADCTANCLRDLGTTADCAVCYASSADCSAEFCLSECVEDPDSCECVECQVENGCTSDFFECSGLAAE